MHYNEILNYSIYNIPKKEKEGRSFINSAFITKPFKNLL